MNDVGQTDIFILPQRHREHRVFSFFFNREILIEENQLFLPIDIQTGTGDRF